MHNLPSLPSLLSPCGVPLPYLENSTVVYGGGGASQEDGCQSEACAELVEVAGGRDNTTLVAQHRQVNNQSAPICSHLFSIAEIDESF